MPVLVRSIEGDLDCLSGLLDPQLKGGLAVEEVRVRLLTNPTGLSRESDG